MPRNSRHWSRQSLNIMPSLSRFDFNRRKMVVQSLRLIAARRGDFYNSGSTNLLPNFRQFAADPASISANPISGEISDSE
jgi:hypothetical protein